MGDVVELRRQTCPCGWALPKGLEIRGAMLMTGTSLEYVCPECGRRIAHDLVSKIEEKPTVKDVEAKEPLKEKRDDDERTS